MRVPGTHGRRRWIAAVAVAAGLTLTGVVSPPHALAAGSAITGVVEDTSGAAQGNVTVKVINPATDATVTTTTTAPSDGTFTASVASGTYNVEFIPQSSTGLQSYLATGVATGTTPLTIILKTAVEVQLQGTLTDTLGNLYTSAGVGNFVEFRSPLNPGVQVPTDAAGNYSVALLADQNFTATADTSQFNGQSGTTFNNIPVGTLNASQTYNLTLPTAQLTVNVRDASGADITTGGTFQFSPSSISPLPGLPGSSAGIDGDAPLDSNGNTTLIVPYGVTLKNPKIVLNNGLTIPLTTPSEIAGTTDITGNPARHRHRPALDPSCRER